MRVRADVDNGPRWALVAFLLGLFCVLALSCRLFAQHPDPEAKTRPSPYERVGYYHALRHLPEVALTSWTHIAVKGFVVAVVDEDDGDLHLRLSDGTLTQCRAADYASGRCVVAEVRPDKRSSLPEPHVGDTIVVYGMTRYDRLHHWSEINPTDDLQVVACWNNAEPPECKP